MKMELIRILKCNETMENPSQLNSMKKFKEKEFALLVVSRNNQHGRNWHLTSLHDGSWRLAKNRISSTHIIAAKSGETNYALAGYAKT